MRQDGWVVIISQWQWVQVLSTGRLDCLWRMQGHLLQHPFIRSLVNVVLPKFHILHHLLEQCMLRWWHNPVENPPAEASPDFAYKPCKGLKEAVIGESQREEEAGLALCTFPAPCSCVCSKGPHTPILTGADAGQQSFFF
jgi:hypothetical protein